MARKRRGPEMVRAWRLAQEPIVSQQALGAQVGRDGSYIRHYEAGRIPLSVEVARQLRRICRIPLKELLSEDRLALLRGAHTDMEQDAEAVGEVA